VGVFLPALHEMIAVSIKKSINVIFIFLFFEKNEGVLEVINVLHFENER